MQNSVVKKDQLKALAGTILFYMVLFAVFYFVIFKSPDPPLSGGEGIVLNYGLDAEGFGDLQTTASANASDNREDSKPARQLDQPATPAPTPQPQAPATETQQEKVVTTDDEGPVSIPPKEEAKPVTTARETPKTEVAKPTPVVEKPRALYPGKSTTAGANGTNGTSNKPTGNNNGDRPGKVGDQGDPNGSLDSRALYGTPGKGNGGGGGGSGLNMPGWRYDVAPKPDPFDDETGVVKFQIKIDGNGELVSVKVLESNVSPKVVNWYKEQVQRTSFSRTTGGNASAGATGTITFIIRSN
ncbi:hypothetical protein [Rufibacter aurantiacus]|uniref:hypothetical protein n=1 Tax=Rufibacter aurantiacus TaxID=2817374 RepID=UPI001B3081A0|nr:hypothetical protein [Rufibacter aurantiacus]